MRIPLSWLREYVDLPADAQELAGRLTVSGTEVTAVETIGSSYEGIVVGEVRTVAKHPNADRLSLCKVFDGTTELDVVCGAPNVTAGGRYPLAKVGAILPDGKTTIKEAKIRGEASFGMLCAAKELGLSSDSSGLMILENTWAAGTPIAEVFGPPETVFEFEITPNRPDCLSIIGIAREISALYNTPLRLPAVSLTESGSPASEAARVDVEDAAACPRYVGRMLRGVKIGPSPRWLQRRLELAGIRAINNAVDITNYVMLECGHPLHAFDHSLLAEGRVAVRRATKGEKIVTLDGATRELDSSLLVIADGKHPVAVAGVMGGQGSEIRADTSTVFLEAAAFRTTDIRNAVRKLDLRSESSHRFERGVDPASVDWASRRAASLFCEIAGASTAPGVIDRYPNPAPERTIRLRLDRVNQLLGYAANAEDVVRIFRSLQLATKLAEPSSLSLAVPSFRNDLEAEIDLVEEFARINGLDRIPAPAPRAIVDSGSSSVDNEAARLRAELVGLGLREIVNYSLVAEPLLKLFDLVPSDRNVILPRPISADQSVLRTSLIPQMVETLGRNLARQISEAAFFETGRTFEKSGDREIEHARLCVGLLGTVGRAGLDRRSAVKAEEMFGWIKGIWERLSAAHRVAPADWKPLTGATWEPGYAVTASFGEAGFIRLGLVHRTIRREWRMAEPVGVLEVDVGVLHATTSGRSFKAIPEFPHIQRDVAMIVTESVRHEDVLRVIRENSPRELENIQLFDIFRGENVGSGRKSVAYSMTYQSRERTLTDADANGYHDKVKAALKRELNAELRET